MGLSSKQYREHLYENREHPEMAPAKAASSSSLSIWLFSCIPFLMVEYFLEVEFKRYPSGLMFPVGYFVFWGFYQSLLFSKMPALKFHSPARKKAPTPPPYSGPRRVASAPPPPKEKEFLPENVLQHLSVLGLKPTKDWNVIHKKYRELAKLHHPDLNPDITTRGTRFMIYDSAYRNLLKVKKEYFHD